MKKFFSLSMIIAAAAISFISCQKQEFNNLKPVSELSFISEKPSLSDDTKTEWNGSTISWSQGDRIRVAYTCDQVWQNADGTANQNEANGAKTAKLYESNPLTATSEIGQFSIPGNFTSTTVGTYQFYGIYPSSICTDAPQFKFAPSFTVTIPTVQTPLADSFDPAADLMLGKSVQTYTGIPTEPVSIHWTRLVAHANITLSTIKDFGIGEKISTIEFTANPEADMVDFAQASAIKYTSNQDGTFNLSCMVSADERHLRKNTTYGFGFYSTADPILLIPAVFEARPSIIVAPEELSQSVLPNGEMITISYSIENPIDGQTISVTADQTWINNLDISTPGQLSFNIEENSQTTTRTGNIRISYKGAEDVIVMIEQKGISASGEAVIYILDATLNKGTNNNYNNNCDITADGITWNVTGNSTMQPWRIGGKSLSNVDRTVYTKTPFANPLNKISLTLGKSTLSLNSVTLVYSTNADFTGALEVMPSEPVTENTTLTFTADFPTNCYYKFILNVTNSQTKNKYVEFIKIEFIGKN